MTDNTSGGDNNNASSGDSRPIDYFIQVVGKMFEGSEKKAEAGSARTDANVDAGFARTDAKIDSLDKKMDAGFARTDAKNDALDTKMDGMSTKIDETKEKITGLERKIDEGKAGIAALVEVGARLAVIGEWAKDTVSGFWLKVRWWWWVLLFSVGIVCYYGYFLYVTFAAIAVIVWAHFF